MASLVPLMLAIGLSTGQHPARDPQPVSIGIDRSTPYAPGDTVRPFVRVTPGTYATVLRVDTEGRIRILSPATPGGQRVQPSPSRRTTRLPGFRSGPRNGVGFVAVFASPEPFDFSGITRDGRWDYGPGTRGRIVGDPVTGLLQFVRQLSRAAVYHLAIYYVGYRYDHPRFACTGCHAGSADWDPYAASCSRIVATMTVARPGSPWSDPGGPAFSRAVGALPHLVYRPAQTGIDARVPGTSLTTIVEA